MSPRHRPSVRPPRVADESAAATTPDFAERLAATESALRAFAGKLMGRTPIAQDIDDVVQDTLTRALRFAHTLDPKRPIRPWLFGICVRVAADRFRTSRGPARVESKGDERDARCELLAVDARDELEQRLAALTTAQREVLLAFHRDGLSIAEIAASRRVPEGTIKSHLHRARRVLYEQQEGES